MSPLTAPPPSEGTVQSDSSLCPPQPLTAVLKHADGSLDSISLNHTFNQPQIEWFKAGSALNRMKELQ